MAKHTAKKPRKVWRFIKRIFLFLFISSLLYVVICKWIMPPVTFTQVANAIQGNGLKRDYVLWNQISPYAKLAAIASEDQLFPEHNGFDWRSIEKSISADPKKKKRIRGAGASTISQQTAKNVFLWQGEGVMKYIRKVPEFYFTALIELIWGKQRILEVYLNVIEMGPGIYGVEAASEQYFHKHAKSLTKNEAAIIMACLPNPKVYTVKPLSKFVSWKSRWILSQMHNLQGDKDIDALTR